MCGIAGFSIENLASDQDIFASIASRGPDSDGYWSDACLKLFHTRLSIVDLSNAADQPMVSKCGNYILVFNGEIYNYRKLRNKLKNNGADLITESDTEVLLHVLIEKGVNALSEIDGLFAFCFYSKLSGKLFLCRDRYGGKPLYYSVKDQKFMFSSSLSTFDLALHSRHINRDALCEYFHFSTTLSPNTFYQGISQVEPGCYSVIDTRNACNVKTRRYHLPAMGNETTFSKRNVLSFLEKSCSEQDPEYVDMAIFLSGGLDSTGLAHFYSRIHGSKLKTLTVNFGGGNKDEVRLAEKYARSIQSAHTTIDVTYENVLETLVSVTKNFGQPIADAAIIPLCIMCKSLPGNIKVVIQGDGGDEVIGGYKYYKRLYLAMISLPLKPILLLFMMLKKDSIVHRKLRSIYAIVLNSGTERFARIYSNLLAWEKVSTFVTVPVDESVFIRRYETLENARMWMSEESKEIDSVNMNLFFDQMIILPDLYMRKSDVASMHYSKEVRLPLLGNELVDHLNSLRGSNKVSLCKTKLVMRKTLDLILPSFITNAKKRGFSTPYGNWMRSETFQRYLSDHLTSSKILDPVYFKKLNSQHLTGDDANALRLWQLFCLLIWEVEALE